MSNEEQCIFIIADYNGLKKKDNGGIFLVVNNEI